MSKETVDLKKNFDFSGTIRKWKKDLEETKERALKAGMIAHYTENLGSKEPKGKELIDSYLEYQKKQHLMLTIEVNALEASIFQLEEDFKKQIEEKKKEEETTSSNEEQRPDNMTPVSDDGSEGRDWRECGNLV